MSSDPLDKHKSIVLIPYQNDRKGCTAIADKVEKREKLFQFADRYARGQRPQFGMSEPWLPMLIIPDFRLFEVSREAVTVW
jgi:hypothetical protein